jgi:hypothetical protein
MHVLVIYEISLSTFSFRKTMVLLHYNNIITCICNFIIFLLSMLAIYSALLQKPIVLQPFRKKQYIMEAHHALLSKHLIYITMDIKIEKMR